MALVAVSVRITRTKHTSSDRPEGVVVNTFSVMFLPQQKLKSAVLHSLVFVFSLVLSSLKEELNQSLCERSTRESIDSVEGLRLEWEPRHLLPTSGWILEAWRKTDRPSWSAVPVMSLPRMAVAVPVA